MSGAILVIAGLVCGACLTVGGIYWGKGGYANVRTGFAWIVVFAISFAVVIADSYWYYVVKPAKDAPAHDGFSISVGTGLGTDQRAVNTAAAWYSWFRSPLGVETLSPIHRLFIIRITNRQPVRSQIETYRVEALTQDERWVRLTWMDGQNGEIYWLMDGDGKNAKLFNVPKLDSVLSGRVLTPNETVEGWAFFELPESIPLKQPLRIYVKDFGGAETTQEIPRQPEGFAQGASIPIRPYMNRDFSGATLRYYSDLTH